MSRGALRALAVGLGTLALSARLAGQVLAGVAGATLPDAVIAAPTAPALTGIRIDPVAGHTELSIAAAGAAFYVSPPVVRAGRVRVAVDLPGTRLAQLEGPSLPADNGAILALRATDDAAGARLTIDIVAGARFAVRPGAGGLVLVVQGGGAPATTWAVATAGQEAPHIQPAAPAAPAAPTPVSPLAALASQPAPAPVAAPSRAAVERHRAPTVRGRARAALLAGWGLSAKAPVSAPWALLLMALVLGPPCLAAHLARRRAKTAPAARLRTVFPDGSRRRCVAGWLAPAAPQCDLPQRNASGRARPPAPGRAAGR